MIEHGNSDTGSRTRPFPRRLSLTALAPTNFRARATKGSNFRATRFWDARFPGFSATGFLPRPRATFLRSGPGSQAAPACAGTLGRPAPTGAQGSEGERREAGEGKRTRFPRAPSRRFRRGVPRRGLPEGFRDGGRAGRPRARKRRFFPRRRDETAGNVAARGKPRRARFTHAACFSPRRIGGAAFSFYSRIWNAPTFPLPLHA